MEADNDSVQAVDVISISDGEEDNVFESSQASTVASVTPPKGQPKNDGHDKESSDESESEEDDKWIRLTIGQVHPSSIFTGFGGVAIPHPPIGSGSPQTFILCQQCNKKEQNEKACRECCERHSDRVNQSKWASEPETSEDEDAAGDAFYVKEKANNNLEIQGALPGSLAVSTKEIIKWRNQAHKCYNQLQTTNDENCQLRKKLRRMRRENKKLQKTNFQLGWANKRLCRQNNTLTLHD